MSLDLTRPLAARQDRLLQLLTANKGRGYRDVQSKGETADVWLFQEIGFWGTTAQEFAQEVAPLKVDEIVLHLSSPGGDAWDGQAIYHTLKNHRAAIEVRVEGLAASAASTIAMGADKGRLIMAPHSQMMIHEAWVITGGNKRELRKTLEWLTETDNSIAGFYRDRAGGEIGDWLARMEVESWYSDRGAVAIGLADRVDGDEVAENIFDLSAFDNLPDHLKAHRSQAEREPTKREAERALRDAGLSAVAAKAVLAGGWDATDDGARDESLKDLAAFINGLTEGARA